MAVLSVSRKTIKAAALPAEHGGWGFLFEPIALGLLVASSGLGWLLSLSAVCVFLLHQPLKLTIKDRSKGLHLPRTQWAERFLIGYGVLALLSFGAVLATVSQTDFLIPLVLATPLALIQLAYDIRNDSRAFLPEACGAVSLGASASAVALLGGWELKDAMLLWLLLVLRVVPSILYIRTRLKLEKGKAGRSDKEMTWNVNLLAFGVAIFLLLQGYVPILALVPFLVLFIRAIYGISHHRHPTPAKVIGMRELAYGAMLIVFVAMGYALK